MIDDNDGFGFFATQGAFGYDDPQLYDSTPLYAPPERDARPTAQVSAPMGLPSEPDYVSPELPPWVSGPDPSSLKPAPPPLRPEVHSPEIPFWMSGPDPVAPPPMVGLSSPTLLPTAPPPPPYTSVPSLTPLLLPATNPASTAFSPSMGSGDIRGKIAELRAMADEARRNYSPQPADALDLTPAVRAPVAPVWILSDDFAPTPTLTTPRASLLPQVMGGDRSSGVLQSLTEISDKAFPSSLSNTPAPALAGVLPLLAIAAALFLVD